MYGGGPASTNNVGSEQNLQTIEKIGGKRGHYTRQMYKTERASTMRTAVKFFKCQFKGCPYTTRSLAEVRRHVRIEHR